MLRSLLLLLIICSLLLLLLQSVHSANSQFSEELDGGPRVVTRLSESARLMSLFETYGNFLEQYFAGRIAAGRRDFRPG